MSFLVQDLYQGDDNSPSSMPSTSTGSTSSFGRELDLINSITSGLNLDTFISNLNYFSLAWCMFYTLVLMCEFYYFRILYGGGEMGNEVQGVKGIKDITGIWWRYLIVLVGFSIYVSLKNSILKLPVGVLVSLFYIIKLWMDFSVIITYLDYFSWSKPMVKIAQRVFNWKH